MLAKTVAGFARDARSASERSGEVPIRSFDFARITPANYGGGLGDTSPRSDAQICRSGAETARAERAPAKEARLAFECGYQN